MKQVKKVNIKYGTGETLSNAFGVSRKWISHACKGKTNSVLAQKIRIAAINMGGDPIY